MTRARRGWLLGCLAPLLLAGAARALTLEGEVVQVRDQRVHIKLATPVRVAIGAQVQLGAGAAAGKTVVLALSSKFLVLDLRGLGLELKAGDRVKLTLEPLPPPATTAPAPAEEADEDEDDEQGPGPKSPVQIGREAPSGQDYHRQPAPRFEKVPFQGRRPAPKEPAAGGARGQPPPLAGGVEKRPKALEANQVRGELEVGADTAYDDEAGVKRVTPYGRLRLEVRRLGGNERARFVFHGSARQDFGGEDDWTGHNEDQLNARFAQAELAIDAAPEGQLDSFTDRIELGVGRMTIPDMVEAYLVDGLRLGVRAGPVIVFGFGGWAVSPNPQREDYDSLIYGGGLRFGKAFAHEGAIHISLAMAQERFRGEGERDFAEGTFELRYGALGMRGALVVDLYDQLQDDRELDITTGALNLYWQASAAVRVEVGYRERRPVYQADLVSEDRVPGGSELDPLLVPTVLETGARRNGWLGFSFELPAQLELWLRAEVFQTEGDGRDAYGGAAGLARRNLISSDRLSLELAVRRRERGGGIDERSTDPFASVTYSYMGEKVTVSVSLYYRSSIPSSAGESRVGGQGSLDVDFGVGGLGARGWAGAEVRRDEDETEALFYGGLGLRIRF